MQRQVEALRAARPDWELDVVFVDTVASNAAYASGAGEVRRAIASWKPDLVHAHFGPSALFCRSWKGPFVVTFHGSDVRKRRFVAVSRWAAHRADASIVVSEELLPYLRTEAQVIPCGVDTRQFSAGDTTTARGRLGIATTAEPVILFPSSPGRPEKDYPLFEQAFEQLKAMHPEAVALTLGAIAPQDVRDYLHAADAVLMTSTREGSSVVTKEALCCGTRVVSTAVGDMASQLEGFSGCAVVRDRNAEALAVAVSKAIAEPAPAAEKAAVRFDIGVEASRLAEVYERVTRAE